jgi:hypothetical protein
MSSARTVGAACGAADDAPSQAAGDRLSDSAYAGAWCIISAPLILGNESMMQPYEQHIPKLCFGAHLVSVSGMDLTQQPALAAVIDIITNPEAIAVNQNWAGHPGQKVAETCIQLTEISFLCGSGLDRRGQCFGLSICPSVQPNQHWTEAERMATTADLSSHTHGWG